MPAKRKRKTKAKLEMVAIPKYATPKIAKFVDMIYVLGNEFPVGIVMQSSINPEIVKVFRLVENKK